MAYASWSVVFGEQPSAAKWNILGTNDASFNDGTGIASLSNATTAIANPYKFRASRNAAANTGNSAFAVIAFDTEQYDTNGNLSAGVYTAPVAGFYQFNWGIKIAQSGTAQTTLAALHLNGTRTSDGTQLVTTNVTIGGSGSDIVQMAASDTADIRVFCTTTQALSVGTIFGNYFSGHLVSRT